MDNLQNLAAAAAKASPMAYGKQGVEISSIVAVVGTTLSAFLGGWDKMVQALVVMMAMDFVLGILAAAKAHKVDSQVMLWGGVNKALVLALVGLGVILDGLLGMPEPYLRTAMIWFYVGREGLSIVENYGKMGLPLPKYLVTLLEQLKDRGENRGKAKEEQNV